MIRPDEVSPVGSKPASFEIHAKSLEQRADAAIKNADETGRWPAKVGQPRTPYPGDVVADVAEKYRSVGWVVNAHDGSAALTIGRPAAPGAVAQPEVTIVHVRQALEELLVHAKHWTSSDNSAYLRSSEDRIQQVLALARRVAT